MTQPIPGSYYRYNFEDGSVLLQIPPSYFLTTALYTLVVYMRLLVGDEILIQGASQHTSVPSSYDTPPAQLGGA